MIPFIVGLQTSIPQPHVGIASMSHNMPKVGGPTTKQNVTRIRTEAEDLHLAINYYTTSGKVTAITLVLSVI